MVSCSFPSYPAIQGFELTEATPYTLPLLGMSLNTSTAWPGWMSSAINFPPLTNVHLFAQFSAGRRFGTDRAVSRSDSGSIVLALLQLL